MFRDDVQLARACRALLGAVRLEQLWKDDGPTDEALELLEANGGHLSSGERVMFLAAFAFWIGYRDLTLVDVLSTLDGERTRALCSLAIAACEGPHAVDSWLHGQRSFPATHRKAAPPGGRS